MRKNFPSAGGVEIMPLAGDASARRYYRALIGDAGGAVVMLAPDEESVAHFSNMTELMRDLGADTPSIYTVGGRMAALEDLGDDLLQRRVRDMDGGALMEEYRGIIDGLLDFQERAVKHPGRALPCFSLAFDEEKLLWETGFTHKHFLESYLKAPLDPENVARMKREWEWIARELAANVETLCHRDFHSRNIIALGDRRVWIDYQDARMGRRQYDLASLLFDPYVEMPREARAALADYYYERLSRIATPPWDYAGFMRLYELSGLQRIYKALGTYGYQTAVRGVDVYVEYIPRAVETLRDLLRGREELATLYALLDDLLPS